MPRYYPAFLDLRGKLALVVGGGAVALRKVQLLLSCSARIRLVSPQVTEAVSRLRSSVGLVLRPWEAADLDGVRIAFAATDDPAVNARVAREARARGIPVNVADTPSLCDFIVPSVVHRGDLQIAISTGGGSPALARRLRQEIERMVGPEYAELLALLESVRERIRAEIPDPRRRRAVFAELIDGDLLTLIRNGDRSAIRARIEAIVRE